MDQVVAAPPSWCHIVIMAIFPLATLAVFFLPDPTTPIPLFAAYGLAWIFLAFAFPAAQPARRSFFLLLLAISVETSLIIFFARLYTYFGLMDGDRKVHEKGVSLFYSIMTWATVGDGSVSPTRSSRIYAALEALLGYASMLAILYHAVRYAAGKRLSQPS